MTLNVLLMDGGAPLQLSGAYQTAFTCPAGKTALIKKMTFTQTGSGVVSVVSVNLVPAGAAASVNNVIDTQRTVSSVPYESFVCEGHTLYPGWTIQCILNSNPSGAGVNLLVSGLLSDKP